MCNSSSLAGVQKLGLGVAASRFAWNLPDYTGSEAIPPAQSQGKRHCPFCLPVMYCDALRVLLSSLPN